MSKNSLSRSITLKTTIALVIGGIIGSGIFIKPTYMANQIQIPLVILSVWVVAGFLVLIGALSNAEIASMIPETGGQLLFFKEMYGKKFAFLYGWASFVVFNTAGNASVAFICASFTGNLFPLMELNAQWVKQWHISLPFIGNIYFLQNFGLKLLTIFYLVFFTCINVYSTNLGSLVQRILTWLKILAFAFLIIGLLQSSKGSFTNFMSAKSVFNLRFFEFIGAYSACLSAAFWAFDGWNNLTFIAGEIKNPKETIPKSLFIGICSCTIIYLLINISFMWILPISQIAGSEKVAADALNIALGSKATLIIVLLIILSTLGAANANILSTSRVTFALGDLSPLFNLAGKTHSKFKTPANALLLNCFWSVILIFSGSFDILTDMLIFVSWFFYGASGVGLFILRRKWKNVKREYKVIGYPILPAIFVLIVGIFLVATLLNDFYNFNAGKIQVVNSLLGICLTLLGFPIYWLSTFNFPKSKNDT